MTYFSDFLSASQRLIGFLGFGSGASGNTVPPVPSNGAPLAEQQNRTSSVTAVARRQLSGQASPPVPRFPILQATQPVPRFPVLQAAPPCYVEDAPDSRSPNFSLQDPASKLPAQRKPEFITPILAREEDLVDQHPVARISPDEIRRIKEEVERRVAMQKMQEMRSSDEDENAPAITRAGTNAFPPPALPGAPPPAVEAPNPERSAFVPEAARGSSDEPAPGAYHLPSKEEIGQRREGTRGGIAPSWSTYIPPVANGGRRTSPEDVAGLSTSQRPYSAQLVAKKRDEESKKG